MTFRDRAVHVGGYFTCGLLLINGLLADMEPGATVIISLVPGLAFTVGSLAFGRKYRLR